MADPDAFEVWIYDVSSLETNGEQDEAAWLTSLREDVAKYDSKSEISSTTIHRFSLANRNLLAVNGIRDSQKAIAEKLRLFVARLAAQNR